MLHFLTAGYLDKEAVPWRQVVVLAPLDEVVLSRVIDKYRDDNTSGEITFEQEPVYLSQEYVRCPLFTSGMNRTSIKFVLALQDVTGCVIADIEHGEVVEPGTLHELLEE